MSNLNELQGFGYRLKAGYSDRRVGSKVFLLGPDGAMHILENITATTLWGLLSSGKMVVVEDLASSLEEHFVVQPEIARSDAQEFLESLSQLDVLERIPLASS